MTSTSSRAERKERTRQALVGSALTLLADRSLSGLSLREVARAAGVVPTAFYRHFASMDELGVAVVEECTATLRQLIRQARQAQVADPIAGSVSILVRQVAEREADFRFLIRERASGVPAVARAIRDALDLFTVELTADLARMPALADFQTEDLRMAADLMVGAMLHTIQALTELDGPDDDAIADVTRRAERQLRLIALGLTQWR
ncbi:TetR family transcriptional regulator [Jatrophihabitans telluris]|uniref:TetR family transcriptional regulator n=1 Tax=Jatrophihabitans telluris TaxID=2038343 RepID=A0ABY4R130_9ACTN|nr:TetR family transcriptional regulator [Jatrophihabitans telluris]UQX89222.1 TetR family transcriptional regulator [Jatrophihabitans telluris]